MAIVWDADEYHAEFGCYIKWLHGDPAQTVEKLYCMSAFHFYAVDVGYVTHFEYNKYAEYMLACAQSICDNSADWHIRVYTDESTLTPKNKESAFWHEKFAALVAVAPDRVQLLCVKMPRYYIAEMSCHQGLLGVLFRYLPMFDPATSIMLFRDLDNIWTEQHQYFVDKWLAGPEEIFLFLNQNYEQREIADLTPTDVVPGRGYTSILSGVWNLRKPLGTVLPAIIWQKMFAYVESYTGFVEQPQYREYKYYNVHFTYGFDELSLTRVALPLMMKMGMRVYALPIKIWDGEYIAALFDSPSIQYLLRRIARPSALARARQAATAQYWVMRGDSAGLAQYILCLLTNIYFRAITGGQIKNDDIRASLRHRIYPVPLLMGIGLFTFKNYLTFNLAKCTAAVNKFIVGRHRLSLADITAGVDGSAEEEEDDVDTQYNV